MLTLFYYPSWSLPLARLNFRSCVNSLTCAAETTGDKQTQKSARLGLPLPINVKKTMATMEPSYHHESNDLPEETYDIYHQPLTYHYEPDYAREPLHYRMQTEQEVDLSSGVLGLLHTKGAIPMAVVVAVGVILVAQYRGKSVSSDDLWNWSSPIGI